MPVVIKENVIPKHGKRAAYVQIYPIVNPDKSLAFLPSLKAGTSTMSTVLEHESGWAKMKPPIPENCQVFGLIRHPYERWISGTAEHWDPIITTNNNNPEPLIQTSFEQLLAASFEDRHTQPQAWNFDNHKHMILFKLENLHKVWDWLDFDCPGIHMRNHLTMGGVRSIVWKIVAKKAKNRELQIEKLYEEDLQLWEDAI